MLRQYLFLFVFMVTFVPMTTFAQTGPTQEQVQTAREHYSRAEIAFRQGRWLDCATHFERSFQTIFAPELLYNIGLCYERAADTMGDADSIPYMERAVQAYARYIRELPEAEDLAAVRVRLDDLRLLLERARATAAEDAEDVQEETVEETPEPEPVEEDPSEDLVVPDIIVTAPPLDREFGFPWTVTGSAFTVASFVVAIGLSVAAQEQFNDLAATCGQTVMGCAQSEVDGVTTLATGANVMYAVSGVLLAATGVALGLELHFWSTPVETHASVGYSTSF
jgi:hypothetical protein